MADGGRSEPDSARPAHARGVTARRIVLGTQLRRLREDAGISRSDAGYVIRASDSKVSRLELGRVTFKERDVADLLTMYGISDAEEREQFLEMVRMANEPGWWRRYTDVTPSWFQDFVGLQESAARIHTYELQFVPGLLQTEAYVRAVLTRGRPDYAPPDTEKRITLRMQRQRLITGRTLPGCGRSSTSRCCTGRSEGRRCCRSSSSSCSSCPSSPTSRSRSCPTSSAAMPRRARSRSCGSPSRTARRGVHRAPRRGGHARRRRGDRDLQPRPRPSHRRRRDSGPLAADDREVDRRALTTS